jgi:glycerol-3-phosphate dehydrogenase
VASSTAGIPLVGAGVPRHTLEQRLREAGADPAVIGPTIDRNGGDVERVARLMEADPSLAAPLGDRRSSLADVAHAVRHEGAARLSDFTMRRSHLAWFTPDHARKDIGRIAEVMAVELGWTVAERDSAIRDHEQELVAEGL